MVTWIRTGGLRASDLVKGCILVSEDRLSSQEQNIWESSEVSPWWPGGECCGRRSVVTGGHKARWQVTCIPWLLTHTESPSKRKVFEKKHPRPWKQHPYVRAKRCLGNRQADIVFDNNRRQTCWYTRSVHCVCLGPHPTCFTSSFLHFFSYSVLVIHWIVMQEHTCTMEDPSDSTLPIKPPTLDFACNSDTPSVLLQSTEMHWNQSFQLISVDFRFSVDFGHVLLVSLQIMHFSHSRLHQEAMPAIFQVTSVTPVTSDFSTKTIVMNYLCTKCDLNSWHPQNRLYKQMPHDY